MAGAAAGLREVLFGCCCCDGFCVVSRVWVCWVGWLWEMLLVAFAVVEKCWPGGRGKGRRRIRV